MSFLSSITKHFSPTVTEDQKKGIVTITGIKAQWLVRDFCKAWETTSVSTYMFNRVGTDSISFYSFFVPDIYYALYKMRYNKKLYTSGKVFEKLMEELKTKTWFSNSFKTFPSKLNYDKLSELTYTLMPHQLETLQIYDKNTQCLDLFGFLIAADPGVGKTLMSIAIATCLDSDTVIVICPKSIIDTVWVDAITTQFKGRKTYWKANGKDELIKGYNYYIFNFEAIDKAVDLASKNNLGKISIILDESHNFNSSKSIRTNSFLELCEKTKSKDIMFCSGSAVSAIGNETIPLFKAIDPYFNNEVEQRFKRIYKKSATKALEILNNRLGLVSHKIDKSAVLTLADPIRQEIKVKLPNSEKYLLETIKSEFVKYTELHTKTLQNDMHIYEKVYNEAIDIYKKTIKTNQEQKEFDIYNEYIKTIRRGFDAREMSDLSIYCNNFEKNKISPTLSSDLNKKFKEAKSIWKYPNLVILGRFLGNVLGRKRIELHSELIEHSGIDKIVLNGIKKTICFTDYVDTAQTAKKYFEDRGFKPLLVCAETNKDVNNIIEIFRSDIKANPLIATIKSLSTGATLIDANTVIFLNLPFRSKDYQQAIARAHRLGQDTQVYSYDIVLDTGEAPNLSTRMANILSWSEDQVEAIMGTKAISKTIVEDMEESAEEGVSLEWLIEPEDNNIIISIEELLEYDKTELIDKTSILNW